MLLCKISNFFAYDVPQFDECDQLKLLRINSTYVHEVKYSEVEISVFSFYLQTIKITIDTFANLHEKPWGC